MIDSRSTRNAADDRRSEESALSDSTEFELARIYRNGCNSESFTFKYSAKKFHPQYPPSSLTTANLTLSKTSRFQMPAERSSSSSASPRSGHSSGPMSLSRILRGPGYSPSIGSSAAVAVSTHNSESESAMSSPLSANCTPRATRGGSIVYPGPSEYQTPRSSPNPFVVSTPSTGTPTTPRTTLPYQALFNDPLTSPILDSPTNRGSRALRRHGAVALLVPQTPSASNWPACASPAANGASPLDQGAASEVDAETAEPSSKDHEASENLGDGTYT